MFIPRLTSYIHPPRFVSAASWKSSIQMSQLHHEDHSNVWLITGWHAFLLYFQLRLTQFNTGASSGFGKRFVLSILARGDRVIATARSLDKLNELTSSLTHDLAQSLRVSQLDVTEGEETIHRKITLMAKFWGGIDVLVNNAGSFVLIFPPYPSTSIAFCL